MARVIGDTVEELQGSPENSQYWANYAEVLQAHQLYDVAQVAWGVRLGSGDVTPGDLILMLRCEEALGLKTQGLTQEVNSALFAQPNLTSMASGPWPRASRQSAAWWSTAASSPRSWSADRAAAKPWSARPILRRPTSHC